MATASWGKTNRGWAVGGLLEHDQGLDIWVKTGARAGLTNTPVTLAEICLHAGRFQETALLLDEVIRMMETNDEHFYESELWRVRGELALKLSQPGGEAEAAAHFCRGLDVARAQKAKSWELRLVMSQNRLLAKQNRWRQALDDLCEAYGWFTEGQETADLREARAQIETLRRKLDSAAPVPLRNDGAH